MVGCFSMYRIRSNLQSCHLKLLLFKGHNSGIVPIDYRIIKHRVGRDIKVHLVQWALAVGTIGHQHELGTGGYQGALAGSSGHWWGPSIPTRHHWAMGMTRQS